MYTSLTCFLSLSFTYLSYFLSRTLYVSYSFSYCICLSTSLLNYKSRPAAAYHLSRALSEDCVRLEMVSGAGHSDSEPGIIDAIIHATNDFIRDDGDTPSIMIRKPAFGMLEDVEE